MLLAFHKRYPATQEASKNSDTIVWQQIFFWFFGSAPADPDGAVIEHRCLQGDNDPRWDDLLFKHRALHANELAIELLKRRRRKRLSKLLNMRFSEAA